MHNIPITAPRIHSKKTDLELFSSYFLFPGAIIAKCDENCILYNLSADDNEAAAMVASNVIDFLRLPLTATASTYRSKDSLAIQKVIHS